MGVDPRMVRGHVVRDEVEHQLQAALLEPSAQAGERRRAAQVAMHGVAVDREPRAADVVVAEVRQGFRELMTPLGIDEGDRPRRRTGLPDAQEPDPVDTLLGQAVQLGVRHVVEGRALAPGTRQLGQPDAAVDLVQGRIARIGHIC
jgi:hypothetical protein